MNDLSAQHAVMPEAGETLSTAGMPGADGRQARDTDRFGIAGPLLLACLAEFLILQINILAAGNIEAKSMNAHGSFFIILRALAMLFFLACYIGKKTDGWRRIGMRAPVARASWQVAAGYAALAGGLAFVLWKILVFYYPETYTSPLQALGIVEMESMQVLREAGVFGGRLAVMSIDIILFRPVIEELLFRGAMLAAHNRKIATRAIWSNVLYIAFKINIFRLLYTALSAAVWIGMSSFIVKFFLNQTLSAFAIYIPFCLIFSVCYTCIRLFTGSLLCSILAHCVHGALAIILLFSAAN